MEVETQSAILIQGLLTLESRPSGIQQLEQLMRASHSLKGAARIIGRRSAVLVAHTMENYFVAAQEDAIRLQKGTIAILLQGIDILARISRVPDDSIAKWEEEHQAEIETFLRRFSQDDKSKQGLDSHSSRISPPEVE